MITEWLQLNFPNLGLNAENILSTGSLGIVLLIKKRRRVLADYGRLPAADTSHASTMDDFLSLSMSSDIEAAFPSTGIPSVWILKSFSLGFHPVEFQGLILARYSSSTYESKCQFQEIDQDASILPLLNSIPGCNMRQTSLSQKCAKHSRLSPERWSTQIQTRTTICRQKLAEPGSRS